MKVKFSIDGTLPNIGSVVEVTDMNSNTTEYHPSFPVFAKSIGRNPESLRQQMKAGKHTGYMVKFL